MKLNTVSREGKLLQKDGNLLISVQIVQKCFSEDLKVENNIMNINLLSLMKPKLGEYLIKENEKDHMTRQIVYFLSLFHHVWRS